MKHENTRPTGDDMGTSIAKSLLLPLLLGLAAGLLLTGAAFLIF